MKNKSLILVVTLIAIAAMLVSGGTVIAADGWHGGHGSRGLHGGGHGWNGGHGGHGGGGYRSGGWGWPLFGLGVAAGAVLSYPYYYESYPYYYPYGYGYAPSYRPSPRVIYREREYEPDQEYESSRDYEPAYDEQTVRTRPSATSANASAYWYYCKQSNAYYPYVRRCAGGWEKVPALPPSSGTDDK